MKATDIKLGHIYHFEARGSRPIAQPYRKTRCGDFTPDGEEVDGYECRVYDAKVPEVGLEANWFLEAADLDDTVSEEEKKLFLLKTIK